MTDEPPLPQRDVARLLDLANELWASGSSEDARRAVARAETESAAWGPAVAGRFRETVRLVLGLLDERDRLRDQAVRDPLTGLHNRRFLETELGRLVDRGLPLSVALLDLDRFRDFNEQHGHLAGDFVLRRLAAMLVAGSREGDLACRYGGEEFVLVMDSITAAAATERLEGLREALAGQRIRHAGRDLPPITMSVGVSEFPRHGASVASLLHAADRAMYAAKRSGRNRVAVSPEHEPA